MPKAKKMGRPPIPKKKRLSKIYSIRFRTEDEREIESAIQASGQTQANWIRESLLKAARST
jgi:predicted DNA-binding protein